MAGQIVHFEIPADDTGAAQAFWGSLFGWQFASSPTSGPTYQVITTPAKNSIQGGVYRADERQPKSASMATCWGAGAR